LHHVEQRGDARRDILAGGRRRSDVRVVAFHQLRYDRRDRFGELMLEPPTVRGIDFRDARYLRRGLRRCIVSGDERMDFTELRGSGHRRERGVLDVATVMLDQNQNVHFAIPRPLSRSTSSSTLPTLMPAWRLGGS